MLIMENTTDSSHKLAGGICELTGSRIYFYVAILILLAVISTLENLVVIIVICKHKALRTPSLLLLGILSTIDFLTGCVVTPIKAIITLEHDWPLFKMFGVMFIVVVVFSFSTIMLISFDRFFHVYYLEKYNLKMGKLSGALFLTWIPPLMLIFLVGVDFALVHFVFCILAMIGAYHATIVTLRKYTSNAISALRLDVMEKHRQAVHTTLIIVIVFTLMNILPIVSIVLGLMGTFYPTLCAVTYFALLANAAVNPVIYCLRIPCMRQYISNLFRIRNDTGRENTEEIRDISLTEGYVEEVGDTPLAVIVKIEGNTKATGDRSSVVTPGECLTERNVKEPDESSAAENTTENAAENAADNGNISLTIMTENEDNYLTYL